MTGIKICGLTRATDMAAALDAGADRVGFVLAPGSPRTISIAQAAELAARARGRAHTVAVLVNPTDEELMAVTQDMRPDFLQLHGRETTERVAQVRRQFTTPVIKALGIANADDVIGAQDFQQTADELLLDAKPPKNADRAGGFGQAFDWSLLRNAEIRLPWLLAGGLNPQNVAGAIAATNAPFVDVSSGVETAPGLKDAHKIKAFIANVRGAA